VVFFWDQPKRKPLALAFINPPLFAEFKGKIMEFIIQIINTLFDTFDQGIALSIVMLSIFGAISLGVLTLQFVLSLPKELRKIYADLLRGIYAITDRIEYRQFCNDVARYSKAVNSKYKVNEIDLHEFLQHKNMCRFSKRPSTW
jgi:hypothetical protein